MPHWRQQLPKSLLRFVNSRYRLWPLELLTDLCVEQDVQLALHRVDPFNRVSDLGQALAGHQDQMLANLPQRACHLRRQADVDADVSELTETNLFELLLIPQCVDEFARALVDSVVCFVLRHCVDERSGHVAL